MVQQPISVEDLGVKPHVSGPAEGLREEPLASVVPVSSDPDVVADLSASLNVDVVGAVRHRVDRAVDRLRLAGTRRKLRLDHDFKAVIRVLRLNEQLGTVDEAVDEVS